MSWRRRRALVTPAVRRVTAIVPGSSSPRLQGVGPPPHHGGPLLSAASVDRATRDCRPDRATTVPEFVRPEWASLTADDRAPAATGRHEHVKPSLLAMAGAVLLVLMIACVNVTNLLLAACRQRRASLHARRTRRGTLAIVRQLLTESVLLAAIGGALGLVVAELGVRTLWHSARRSCRGRARFASTAPCSPLRSA